MEIIEDNEKVARQFLRIVEMMEGKRLAIYWIVYASEGSDNYEVTKRVCPDLYKFIDKDIAKFNALMDGGFIVK